MTEFILTQCELTSTYAYQYRRYRACVKDEIALLQMRPSGTTIEMANVVVLMTNVKDGVTANDQDVAQMLLKAKKRLYCLP